MNASKEQAAIALDTIDKVIQCEDTSTKDLDQVRDFIIAAKSKLPREASFPKPAAKAKSK